MDFADTTLEYIREREENLGFCLLTSVVEFVKRELKYEGRCSAKNFMEYKEINQRWKKEYGGKIKSSKEIVDEIVRRRLMLSGKARHLLGKVRSKSRIYYRDLERVIEIFIDEEKLNDVLYHQNLNPNNILISDEL